MQGRLVSAGLAVVLSCHPQKAFDINGAERGCHNADKQQCALAARYHANAGDAGKATTYWFLGCDHLDGTSCFEYARISEAKASTEGEGALFAAFSSYKKACDWGTARGCAEAARIEKQLGSEKITAYYRAYADTKNSDSSDGSSSDASASADEPTDSRSELEKFTGAIVAGGETCEVDDRALWTCSSGGNTVFINDNGDNTLVLRSTRLRAFGKPCSKFKTAIRDANTDKDLVVTCDDERAHFVFTTAVEYGRDSDAKTLVIWHAEAVERIVNLLRSVNALRE